MRHPCLVLCLLHLLCGPLVESLAASFNQKGLFAASSQLLPAGSSSSLEKASTTTMMQDTKVMSSLAGDYLVHCSSLKNVHTFTLTPLDKVKVDPCYDGSDGARAWSAVHSDPAAASNEASITLQASRDENRICVTISSSEKEEKAGGLLAVLSRILVQWVVLSSQEEATTDIGTWSIEFPGEKPMELKDVSSEESIRKLFGSLDPSQSEIVEMVDRNGTFIGRIPRKLVHVHNLLHRGIGMFVTAGKPIIVSTDTQQPDLYVHRRTDTKRIFPSLYDMFVGGVSLAGEEAAVTARREVAEELGLSLCKQGQLSDPLLTCVVCTGYNRCVVVLFSYTMDMDREKVSWQEEEVAWGSFVPYANVEAAADRSIQRLAESGSWPGRLPAIQSTLKGASPDDSDDSAEWASWDFVPDGLLVWEAWLQRLQ